jgi:hypothetical protein
MDVSGLKKNNNLAQPIDLNSTITGNLTDAGLFFFMTGSKNIVGNLGFS